MSQAHTSKSAEETRHIAATFAAPLPPGTLVALHGGMGTGKTCFAQGVAQALGIHDIVNSPTFTLINEYPAERPLFHADLYRVESEHEALDLGLAEYAQRNGLLLIEWPDRIHTWLQEQPHWRITIETARSRNERLITIQAPA